MMPFAAHVLTSGAVESACYASASSTGDGFTYRRRRHSVQRRIPRSAQRRADKGRDQAWGEGTTKRPTKRETKGAMQSVMQGADVAATANALLEGLKLDRCETPWAVLTSGHERIVRCVRQLPKTVSSPWHPLLRRLSPGVNSVVEEGRCAPQNEFRSRS